MKIRTDIQKYKDEPPILASTRIKARLIDALIFMVLALCFIFAGTAILGAIPSYKNMMDLTNSERIECYKISEESKIYTFEDDTYETFVGQEEIFKDYCIMHIMLSFNKDNTEFLKYDIAKINNPKELQEASYETDTLAYFYVNYVPKYNENNNIVDMGADSPKLYFYKQFKKFNKNLTLWNLDEVNYDLPYLNFIAAIDLYKYLNDSSYQAGLTTYNYIAQGYKELWNQQVGELVNSERYQYHYNLYFENYASCCDYINLMIFIVYVIVFFVTFIVPIFILKDCKTVGKKIFKVKIIDKDGYEPRLWQKILRNVALFVFSYGLMLIPSVLAGGFSSGIMYPLFTVFGIGISNFAIMIVMLFVSFFSFIIMSFTKYKKSLQDLCSLTRCIDGGLLAAEEKKNKEKKEEVIELKEEEIIETPAEPQHFDSSSFDNSERVELKSVENDDE